MILVGRCKEICNDENLPSIKDMISENPLIYKQEILHYLKSGKIGAIAAGRAYDVINGNVIPGDFVCYNDGEYVWRSDTIYYFDKYNLSLEKEFIEHILKSI